MQGLPGRDDLGTFIERAVLPPGWHVLHEPSVESTNDLARAAAARDWPGRSVFVADYQTKGRGRHGRTWLCPPMSGLLMSVLLRRRDAPPYTYTMLAAVALCEAVERLLNLEPEIKWPNDVLVDGRKVAGVLAEVSDDGRERTVIVGMGTNVNVRADDLSDLPNAGSLALEAGHAVHRGELLVLILERFESWLKRPVREMQDGLWRAWNGRLWGRDQMVSVQEGTDRMRATVLGGEPDGSLLVRTEDGATRRVVAGEILP
jgi:BirA family biotin operon repressor/biotin-[acetyl-CoA-carboxylase] ligase